MAVSLSLELLQDRDSLVNDRACRVRLGLGEDRIGSGEELHAGNSRVESRHPGRLGVPRDHQ